MHCESYSLYDDGAPSTGERRIAPRTAATLAAQAVVRLASGADETLSTAPKWVDAIVPTADFVYVATNGNNEGTFGPGTLQRVPRAGGDAEMLLNASSIPSRPVVMDPTVFFLWGGRIHSLPVEGGQEPLDSEVKAGELIADGTDLVYAESNFTNFPIFVAPSDDLSAAVEIVPEVFDPILLGVVEGFVYFLDDDENLLRVPKAGGDVETVRAADAEFPYFAHSKTDIFSHVTDADGITTVRRVPITGGEPVVVQTFSSAPSAVASSATHDYVAIGSTVFEVAR